MPTAPEPAPADIPAPESREWAWPPVSVVVPTLDRPGLLERAAGAILEQNYPGPIQCVVVFDHVPVRQLAVPAGEGRRLLLVGNDRVRGLAGARNTGRDHATGALIGFCDDDDQWRPEKLRRQVTALREQPECVAVGCGIRLSGPGIERERAGRTAPVSMEELLADRTMEVNSSTVLIRREVLAAVGPVDERIPGGYGEDYDLLLRIAARGPIAMVPEPLTTLSWDGQSVFFHRWPMIVEALRYLLAKHPEFQHTTQGRARIHGQIGYALASAGRRREALAELWQVLRLNPLEKRLLLTVPVVLGLVSGDRLLRFVQRRGRGV